MTNSRLWSYLPNAKPRSALCEQLEFSYDRLALAVLSFDRRPGLWKLISPLLAGDFQIASGESMAQLARHPRNADEPGWRRAGGDDEVILQLPLITVINQVNSRINGRVLYLAVGGKIAARLRWIFADEIATLPGSISVPVTFRRGAAPANSIRTTSSCWLPAVVA